MSTVMELLVNRINISLVKFNFINVIKISNIFNNMKIKINYMLCKKVLCNPVNKPTTTLKLNMEMHGVILFNA